MKKLSAVLSLLLFGCGDKLDDPRQPTGSQTIATSSDYSALYIANTTENTVTRLPIDGTPVEVAVEGEPSRVARIDERVFVTLRANRAIAVMVDDGAGLAVDQTIPTGAEPIGIVASEDGKRFFVAASLEGKVYEYDATSLAEVRSWDVKDEPRWLALHPSGVLYVASAYNGTFTHINLDSGKVHETRLPDVVQRSDELGDDVELDRRITGDLAISADGQYLAVPAMYFDTATPVIEADATQTAEPVDARPVEQSGYASGGTNQRFNAIVAVAQIEGDGEPQIEDAELVRISAANIEERDGSLGFSPETNAIQGYPASVTISPDSATTYATIEGGRGVAAFPTSRADDSFDSSVLSASFDEADQALGGRSFTTRTVVAAATDSGPRGLAFTGPREAFVYNFLDRTVQQVDVAGYQDAIYEGGDRFQLAATIGRPMIVSRVAIDPQVDLGRRLFYATNDSKMSAGGIGLSCATCHFDGRADGLTWMFDRGPRQTPSLAGKVSLTEPVRWGAERATVADDVRQTSQGLMGGFGITDQDVLAVAAFVDSSRDVDAPLKGSDDPNVLAGKALFERSDVACISCHSGPRFTNNQQYDLFGFEGVDTRSLIGIAGSPPYLHDGRAKTLREVLEISRSGAMGNTSALSDDEMFQLESYLRSL